MANLKLPKARNEFLIEEYKQDLGLTGDVKEIKQHIDEESGTITYQVIYNDRDQADEFSFEPEALKNSKIQRAKEHVFRDLSVLTLPANRVSKDDNQLIDIMKQAGFDGDEEIKSFEKKVDEHGTTHYVVRYANGGKSEFDFTEEDCKTYPNQYDALEQLATRFPKKSKIKEVKKPKKSLILKGLAVIAAVVAIAFFIKGCSKDKEEATPEDLAGLFGVSQGSDFWDRGQTNTTTGGYGTGVGTGGTGTTTSGTQKTYTERQWERAVDKGQISEELQSSAESQIEDLEKEEEDKNQAASERGDGLEAGHDIAYADSFYSYLEGDKLKPKDFEDEGRDEKRGESSSYKDGVDDGIDKGVSQGIKDAKEAEADMNDPKWDQSYNEYAPYTDEIAAMGFTKEEWLAYQKEQMEGKSLTK